MLGALRTRFETRSFGAGAAFVAAVAQLAEVAGHHPDVDLRAGHVQLVVRDHDAGGVTEREVRLAERISALASGQGLVARPERVQVLELALDTPVPDTVRPFWAAVLGGAETAGDVVDPAGELPPVWFQTTDSTAPDRQRFHLDVTVPPEAADRRIAAAIAAGGRVVDDSRAPAFVVLADPDGNHACLCTELGRD
ncbi:4a-hydroxytetrahydrobiopterin dehydratase [Prauserella shujinwangii]|uniref:Putative pterin-4-alpha-carbinolamine dehydratase n=2 Tax=Prauserella shujinwangii TaxID=1453103 RepID=A0A2T0M2U5_9PSEU|nr:4a-hydroxytetrahydrobiopterin dehydratase [Prauserella shujinwangii]